MFQDSGTPVAARQFLHETLRSEVEESLAALTTLDSFAWGVNELLGDEVLRAQEETSELFIHTVDAVALWTGVAKACLSAATTIETLRRALVDFTEHRAWILKKWVSTPDLRMLSGLCNGVITRSLPAVEQAIAHSALPPIEFVSKQRFTSAFRIASNLITRAREFDELVRNVLHLSPSTLDTFFGEKASPVYSDLALPIDTVRTRLDEESVQLLLCAKTGRFADDVDIPSDSKPLADPPETLLNGNRDEKPVTVTAAKVAAFMNVKRRSLNAKDWPGCVQQSRGNQPAEFEVCTLLPYLKKRHRDHEWDDFTP